MRKIWPIYLIVCIALAGLLFAGNATGQTSQPVKTWQYATLLQSSFPTLGKTLWLSKDDQFNDNAMGKQGWELIQIVPSRSNREPFEETYYFKRPG